MPRPTNLAHGFEGPFLYPISPQADTTYTFIEADCAKWTRFTNAGAVTATLPPNTDTVIAIGKGITVEQAGAGVVTITAGAGVTIQSAGALVATNGQYAVVSMIKIDTDTWTLFGNLA